MKLIVCVGPGGVGKTTIAATLGLRAARAGKRTLVLTIDPAKRLATALGLDGLSDRVVDVPVGDGFMGAAMLDTKHSFDDLIGRIAMDDQARERILNNRIYASFSRTMARSHAYVATERLYDVVRSGLYDLVVLDTPPTRSALEILDAPGRLVRFLDSRIVNWLVGRVDDGPAVSGASMIRSFLSRVAGHGVIEELGEFLGAMIHLRDGFRDRAETISRLLLADETQFVMVASPDPVSIEDAAYLRDGLIERGVCVYSVVFNRAFHPDPGRAIPVSPPKPVDMNKVPGDLHSIVLWVRSLREKLLADNEKSEQLIAQFCHAIPSATTIHKLPRLEEEPCDIKALCRLGDLLDPIS